MRLCQRILTARQVSSLAVAPQAAAADSAQEGALLLGRQVLQTQLVSLSQAQQRRVREAASRRVILLFARLIALAAGRLRRSLRVEALQRLHHAPPLLVVHAQACAAGRRLSSGLRRSCALDARARTFHGVQRAVARELLRAARRVRLVAVKAAGAHVAPRAAVLGQLPRAHAAHRARLAQTTSCESRRCKEEQRVTGGAPQAAQRRRLSRDARRRSP
jgi:hypothetical protein